MVKISQNFVTFSEYMNFMYAYQNFPKERVARIPDKFIENSYSIHHMILCKESVVWCFVSFQQLFKAELFNFLRYTSQRNFNFPSLTS